MKQKDAARRITSAIICKINTTSTLKMLISAPPEKLERVMSKVAKDKE